MNISEFMKHDGKSGIQRVTRSVLSCLLEDPPAGYIVRPVYADTEQKMFFYANHFMREKWNRSEFSSEDTPIQYASGDFFLGGLDFSLMVEIAQKETLLTMHSSGVTIYFVIHDLLPVLMPQYCFSPVPQLMPIWLSCVGLFDGATCVSKSTGHAMRYWMKEHMPDQESHFMISWFHHGSDIKNSLPTKGLPTDYEITLSHLNKRPSVVMVSTVEPRKGHKQTLAAFEQLWINGVDVNLVLVGHKGWGMEPFEQYVSEHSELGRRLFRLTSISDEYLEKIYANATVALMASEGEGFGLPIIEAAHYNKPLLLRDIPVFREIAGSHAVYFSGLEPSELANAIMGWLELYRDGNAPSSNSIHPLTWKESTQALLTGLPLK